MYTKEQLKEKLEENNVSVDMETLSAYLKSWRIDPVYEDENNVEYFDELAVRKLSEGISLKEQEKDDEEIIISVNDGIYNSINAPSINKTTMNGGNKKLTVDITTQTLALLAESIAQKISDDIANKVKEADVFKPVMNNGKLTRDNEILASQVEKLLEENKKLISRVNFLQQENAKFKHIVGTLYYKQP